MPYIERTGVGEDGSPASVCIPLSSRVGDIVFSPLGTPREGTLVCDGSAISRQAYKALFDFLGTSCGEGDGETTFNLPDLRDQWILCAGTEHVAGDKVSEGLPDITGYQDFHSGATISASGAFVLYETGSTSGSLPYSGSIPIIRHTFDASRSNAIYGASEHVTPKSTVLTPCIAYE